MNKLKTAKGELSYLSWFLWQWPVMGLLCSSDLCDKYLVILTWWEERLEGSEEFPSNRVFALQEGNVQTGRIVVQVEP